MLQDAWSPKKNDVEPGQLPARRVAHVNAHTRVLHNMLKWTRKENAPGGLLSLKCLALPLLEEGRNLTASLCKKGKTLPFAECTRS